MNGVKEVVAASAALPERRLCILQDDTDPRSNAVIFAPAEAISTATVNLLLKHSGGILFCSLGPEQAESLSLPAMGRPQLSPLHTAAEGALAGSLLSVDAREGITTGISAADRALTLRLLAQSQNTARAFVQPGHIFPVKVQSGGVLVRNSLAEGTIDLMRAAGFTPAAAYGDLMSRHGDLLKAAQQLSLAAELAAPLVTLSELVRHRLSTENLVYRLAEARLPSDYGSDLRSYIYGSRIHGEEHLAIIKGPIDPAAVVLTRVQTEATLSDVFGGAPDSSREVIKRALAEINAAPAGVLLYLRKPGVGNLQRQVEKSGSAQPEPGPVTISEYGIGAQILRDLGVTKIELLTNTTKSLAGLEAFGIEIAAQRQIG